MKCIYSDEASSSKKEELGRSVFLAGPTPRSKEVKSWRPEAIKLFEKFEFNGTIIIPEGSDGTFKLTQDEQIEWEERYLIDSTVILFWIPRDLKTMPGFTTNDEWGTWKHSGKVVLGIPFWAEKVNYQTWYAKKYKIPMALSLEKTIWNAVMMIEDKNYG